MTAGHGANRGFALTVLAAVCAVALTGCGGAARVDSGGFSESDRSAAQAAMNALEGTNVQMQLLAISQNVQEAPAACRVHLVSRSPRTFHVYVFWTPWLAGEDYTWLNMQLTGDPVRDTFHLGAAHPVLPSGQLSANGRSVVAASVDTTLLSLYGPGQARKTREVLAAHAEDVFAKPTSSCQVLMNGDLRLIPNP